MKVLAVLLIVALAGQTWARSMNKVELERIAKLLDNLKNDKSKGKSDESVGPWSDSDHVDGPAATPGGFDYNALILEHCGIDLPAVWASMESGVMPPVGTAELQGILDTIRGGASDASADLDTHKASLTALETALEDTNVTPENFIALHGQVLETFLGSVQSTLMKGMCAHALILPVRIRMEFAGVTGFRTAAKCNNAGTLVWKVLEASKWDFASLGNNLLGKLNDVGASLRSDISCMIRDVKEYSQYMDNLKAADQLTGRAALILVDTMSSHLESIGEDAVNLMIVANTIGDALKYDSNGQNNVNKANDQKRATLLKDVTSLVKALKQLNI